MTVMIFIFIHTYILPSKYHISRQRKSSSQRRQGPQRRPCAGWPLAPCCVPGDPLSRCNWGRFHHRHQRRHSSENWAHSAISVPHFLSRCRTRWHGGDSSCPSLYSFFDSSWLVSASPQTWAWVGPEAQKQSCISRLHQCWQCVNKCTNNTHHSQATSKVTLWMLWCVSYYSFFFYCYFSFIITYICVSLSFSVQLHVYF